MSLTYNYGTGDPLNHGSCASRNFQDNMQKFTRVQN